jgi:hypothetical protein
MPTEGRGRCRRMISVYPRLQKRVALKVIRPIVSRSVYLKAANVAGCSRLTSTGRYQPDLTTCTIPYASFTSFLFTCSLTACEPCRGWMQSTGTPTERRPCHTKLTAVLWTRGGGFTRKLHCLADTREPS